MVAGDEMSNHATTSVLGCLCTQVVEGDKIIRGTEIRRRYRSYASFKE